MKCHDAGGATGAGVPVEGGTALRPFSSNSKDVPDVFSQFDTGHTFFHPVRGVGNNPYCTSTTTNGDFITMESPWNQTADDHDLISCFDCHMANGHGGANQRMLPVNIDFDNMATLNLTTMGTPINTFCTTCHKASLYVDAQKPEQAGSAFPEHAGGLGNHGMPNNELSCMGCHGAPYNHGGLAGGNGAAPGIIHGGSYTWTESIASGNDADYFVLGGYINGYYDNGTGGVCGGGTCSHANGKTYSRP